MNKYFAIFALLVLPTALFAGCKDGKCGRGCNGNSCGKLFEEIQEKTEK